MLDRIRMDLNDLPEGNYCEVSFENFEKDPVNALKEIYSEFELDFHADYEKKVKSYISQLKSYKKNEYSISEDEKDLIRNVLTDQFNYYNYELN